MNYKEEIGLLVDKCENLIAASELPLPASLNLECLRDGLAGIAKRLREIEEALP